MLIQGVTFAIEVAITGEQATSQNTQAIVAVILANPLFILATTIGGPIMEEFVFRYAFIHLIQPFTNFWIAATVSSAIFSLAHADGHFLFISLWDFSLLFVQANWKNLDLNYCPLRHEFLGNTDSINLSTDNDQLKRALFKVRFLGLTLDNVPN